MIIPFATKKVRVTSPYAERALGGKAEFHTGYDLVGVGSYDITCAVAGTVVSSRIITDKSNLTWQWGNYVCIKGIDGNYYYYCHMASRSVAVNQKVNVGDKLGVMGNTGYSFGAHLHFEVRQKNGKTTICPIDVLGIPNAVGTYEMPEEKSQLDIDVDILASAGVIKSPNYWKKHGGDISYLPDLIHAMAVKVKR